SKRKKVKTLARGRRERRRRRKGISRRKMSSERMVSGFVKSDGSVQVLETNGLILLQSQSFVVMGGYSSTAVYKEWKLSKSQGRYVIFAKSDQGSGLVSNCLLVSLFVEGRCSCGFRMFGRMAVGGIYESQAVQILLKLSRFKFEVKLQKRMVSTGFGTRHIWYFEELKDHNGACSSKDCFYTKVSRLLHLMNFFSASKVIKQMGFCGISPDVFSHKQTSRLIRRMPGVIKKEAEEAGTCYVSRRMRQEKIQELIALEEYEWKRQLVVEQDESTAGGSHSRWSSVMFQTVFSARRVKESQASVSRFKLNMLWSDGVKGVQLVVRVVKRISAVLVWFLHRKHGVKRHRGRVTVGIHRDQGEQFKVELFESITKLNKFKKFSKSSYKEINSKVCWYCHKRVQEGLSYWKMEFLVTSGTGRGVCIPRSGKVRRLAKHRFFATAKVSQELSQLSRLELGLQGSKEQWQGSLQVIARQMLGGNKFQEAFEAERMKLRSIFFSGDCKEMQGDTEDEQVCSITEGKLKRR
ncbi:hypothetical protein IGI04_029621, partial [Brassica rapa subsp. trilocularis]